MAKTSSKTPKIVNISEAKTHLSSLIAQIAKEGGEVIIGRAGAPVAKLVGYTPPAERSGLIGMFAGQIEIPDDFDEWTPELDALFYGESE